MHIWKAGRKPLPRSIDGLFAKGKSKAYEMVCGECYRRVKMLGRRFRPSFGGTCRLQFSMTPNSRIFTIRTFNEYGNSAYLSEDMRKIKSLVRSIWTGENVILERDRVLRVV